MVQVMGHKHGFFYEMLSCAPSERSPWPYCLNMTTIQGHKKHGLGPPHNTTGEWHQQLPQVPFEKIR
jgi:hypothetical protein